MDAEVLIVGAGIAGLECARTLAEGGLRPLLLERSRGVGGRCATRRIDGRPVDHGIGFYHGDDPEFLASLRRLAGDDVIEGWPRVIDGHGTPCQPNALAAGQQRLALRSGVTAFPKALARELPVEHEVDVVAIEPGDDGWRATASSGRTYRAPRLVLALAAAQARRLVEPLADRAAAGLEPLDALLGMVGGARCLTVIAGYGAEIDRPAWDVVYPEQSRLVQVASHDSSKRGDDAPPVLVLQALPCWSRGAWERDADDWTRDLLDEAARLLGPWAASPRWVQSHRWKYCRADVVDEFTQPVLARPSAGAGLGIAGEVFAPGGGVQAAWRSGRRLARRIIEEHEGQA